jgi:ubiquinone/menaquinone biosynthesis C-methylase UbiE
MALSIQRYMEKGRKYRVLDFGSGTSPRQTLTHRSLLGEYDCDYTGADIREGDNIDLVMKKPYRVQLKSNSIDIVLSGQVFEHVPFFWASLLEIARVMKPGAYFSRSRSLDVRLLADLPGRLAGDGRLVPADAPRGIHRLPAADPRCRRPAAQAA